MMWMILIVVLVLLVLFAVFVATRPDTFVVTRSTTMAAPPDRIFAQVNDLRQFQAWSPWANLDPDCRTTYEGPRAGKGASFAWSGNNKIGEGKLTVLESQPHERIAMRLDFLRPFKGTNDVEFRFEPQGEQTRVTWTMTGKPPLCAKIMSLVINMDKMCGRDFEKGLASMKSLVESPA